MKIKKLTLENFRQFKDREVIEFSQDNDANITLILGDNTSGKTTILQGFLWCLYGRDKINFKSKDQLYNEESAIAMDNNTEKQVSVSVELEHGEESYIIDRKQYAQKQNNSMKLVGQSQVKVFIKEKNGQTKQIDPVDVINQIEDILPPDLSEYFFYDTERFGNITDKQDVTNSVKGLLGLTILENAIDHLGRRTQSQSVIGRIHSDLNSEGDKNITELNKEINDIDEKITKIKLRQKQNEIETEKYESRLKEENEKLSLFEKTKQIQKEVINKRERLMSLNMEANNLGQRFFKNFQKGTLDFFIKPMLKESSNMIAKTTIKEDFIRGMNADSIADIIERGECVCGTKVHEHGSEYVELQKALKVIPPHSIGVLVDKYQTTVNDNIAREPYVKDAIFTNYKDIIKTDKEKMEIDHEVTQLEKQIKGIEEAKTLQEQVDEIRSILKRLMIEKGKLEGDLQNENANLDERENKLKNYLRVTEQNKEVMTLLKYAENVAKWFRNDFDTKHSEIKGRLEERVNYYFQKIYHGDRRVKIDKQYRVTLYDSTNNELTTDESAGLETVKNFAFIAGLVNLAKDKLDGNKKDEDVIYEEEDYPLVLDAPFSNVDEKHVLRISNVLPTVTGQLILIVMEKDWNYASNELGSKVGKTYKLDKQTELYTKIKEC